MTIIPFCSRFVRALACLAVFAAISIPSQGQARIATLDLKRVFDNYYETKQADARLKEDATAAETTLKNMLDDYQKANEDYKKLVDSAADVAISNDERERRKKAAENKLIELKEIEKNVGQYRRETQERLDLQKLRMRDSILRKINEVVQRRAREGNFSLVVDVSAESANRTLIVLYSNGENDMTEAVLSEMNRNAPPGILDVPAASANPSPSPALAPSSGSTGGTRAPRRP